MTSEQMGRLPAQLVGAVTVLGALGLIIVYGYGIVSTLASFVGGSPLLWLALLAAIVLSMVGLRRRELLVRARQLDEVGVAAHRSRFRYLGYSE